ncbi:MAG TPA: ribosomal protein S18-alanine N-acetyltransferase [Terriglobales bacterium]
MNREIPSAISNATVRKACVADIPAMMGLTCNLPTASQWSEAQYFELFALGSSSRLALVIEHASSLLGFLVARSSREEYEIENIAVSVGRQRQGVGAKLLKELMRIAGRACATKVFLEVRESNVAARALYSKLGFTQVGERKNYYRNPEESAVLYQILMP